MDGTDAGGRRSRLGRTTVQRLGPIPTGIGVRSLYTWRPGPAIARDLPPEFRLRMHCLTGDDGVRRFLPAEELPAFILGASLGGLAILARRRGMEAGLRGYHHGLRLLFQHAGLSREHLARSFLRRSDHILSRADGVALGGGDVLPDRLGLDGHGQGHRWSVDDLLAQGRAEAIAAGEANPDPGRWIAAGLHRAARLDPLDPDRVAESGASGLVSMALFDTPPPDRRDDDEARAVERLLDLLGEHLDGDTKAFNRWFFDGRDGLIRRIAKQVGGGGPIPREVVRRGMLGLVRAAYESVGTCVSAQMEAFLGGLRRPAGGAERSLFAALYLGQDHLGGMPLVMLRDRFPFLRGAVLEVMADPDDRRRVGVLLRMLAYYGEMAERRRAADRAYKGRALHRNVAGRVAMARPPDPDHDVPASVTPEVPALPGDVAGRLRRLRGISCPCGAEGIWEGRLPGDAEDDPVEVELDCIRCGRRESFMAGLRALRQIGRDCVATG